MMRIFCDEGQTTNNDTNIEQDNTEQKQRKEKKRKETTRSKKEYNSINRKDKEWERLELSKADMMKEK